MPGASAARRRAWPATSPLGQSITADDESNGSSEQLTNLIQTDADIQPGDSGGALADQNGQVIGVDTAASAGFSFQTLGNQGFAIPINQAVGIANQIRAGQASSAIHIGATAFLGVLVNSAAGTRSGASLRDVVPNGPAATAGLQGGDTITSLGGKTVDSSSTLTDLISRYHPGDKVQVAWVDSSGESHQATIKLTSGPAA